AGTPTAPDRAHPRRAVGVLVEACFSLGSRPQLEELPKGRGGSMRRLSPCMDTRKPPPRRFRRGLSVCGASERRFVGLGGCRTRRRAPRVRAGGAASAGLVHLRRGVPQRRADLIHRQLDDGALLALL